MANFKQIKPISMFWKTILRTALLTGPPEGHGLCQQASVTSPRQCGTAEGRVLHCSTKGMREPATAWGGNGMPIKWQRDLCQPERHRQPWRVLGPSSGSCREESTGIPSGTALHLWVHNSQMALMSFLKWATADARAARGVSALLKWLSCNRSAALATAWPLEAAAKVLSSILQHGSRSRFSNTGILSNVLPQKLLEVPQATGQQKC